MPNEQDKIKSGFEDLLDTREDFSRSLVYSLLGLAREKGERERKIDGKSRVVWLRFGFKFKS
jgi:hypothetical protein